MFTSSSSVASQWSWDVAVQPTVDVKIAPEMAHDNLERLASALNELEAGIRVGGEKVEVPGGLTADLIGQISVLNLVTVAGALDLTIRPAGTDGCEDLIEHSVDVSHGDVTMPTEALGDVARSKEGAGRGKDLRVLLPIYAHLIRMNRG